VSVVSVIASGPSAAACEAENAPGYRIGVNDMFRHVRVDAVLSMDGLWAFNRLPVYFAKPTASVQVHVRRSAFKYFPDKRDAFPHINVFDCDNKSDVMSPDRRVLNGRHSGQCALNLAFTMKPRTVFLYGFDLTDPEQHAHPDYEWKGQGNTNSVGKFREWADGFDASAVYFRAAGIQVFNTNRRSGIRAFPYWTPA
jgi:hypothetical protein